MGLQGAVQGFKDGVSGEPVEALRGWEVLVGVFEGPGDRRVGEGLGL